MKTPHAVHALCEPGTDEAVAFMVTEMERSPSSDADWVLTCHLVNAEGAPWPPSE